MSNIKLVMLDFDGTIANSFESIIHCADKMCQNAGLPFDRKIIDQNMGCTTENCISLLTGITDPEYIKRLHAQGIKFSITSNNIVPAISYVVNRLGLMPYLDNIIGIDCVERGKPEADIAIESMRRAGVSPEEAVAVGDSTFDMMMGRGAGCHCCGVSYGCDTPKDLVDNGAEWVIDSFCELEKIVLG